MEESEELGFFERLLGIEEVKVPYTMHGDGRFSLVVTCNGPLGFHDCTVTLVAYGDKKKGKEIDVEIKWLKVLGMNSYQVKDYRDRFFHISPHDIGISIQAVITSKDPQYPGSKTFSIPNVKLNSAIKPEIEGLLLNHESSFKVYALQIEEKNNESEGMKFPPNLSYLDIQRPYLCIRFDPELQSRRTLAMLACDRQLNMLVNTSVKFELDKRNTTVLTLVFTEDIDPQTGKPLPSAVYTRLRLRFDSRMQRDICFIYAELTRLLQPRVIEDLLSVYNNLLRVPWSFLLPRSEYDSPPPLSFNTVLEKDLIREQLKKMVRMHSELSQENIRLMDCVDILEADLILAATELKKLIDDAIKAKESRRPLTKREVSRYEMSNQSIVQETSVVIDGVRTKGGKRKARALDASRAEARREAEEELAAVKNYVATLKKEIEGARHGRSDMSRKPEVSIFKADVSEIKGGPTNNATISTEYLQRKALREVITRYNKKAGKRLEDLKEANRGYKELHRRFEASLTNETYHVGLGSNPDVHALYLAAAIGHYYTVSQDYQETLTMMQKYYNVEVKLQVLKELLDDEQMQQVKEQNISNQAAGSFLDSPDDGLGLQQEEMERLQEELAILEEENKRLETEHVTQNKRAELIDKGLKKTRDEVALKQKENLDQRILDLEAQLLEVKQEFELLSSVAG